MYNHIQENIQSISSMVMNIIQTSMTAQKQFTGGNSAWDSSRLYNVSEQIPKTKPKVTINKSAINKYKLPVPEGSAKTYRQNFISSSHRETSKCH